MSAEKHPPTTEPTMAALMGALIEAQRETAAALKSLSSPTAGKDEASANVIARATQAQPVLEVRTVRVVWDLEWEETGEAYQLSALLKFQRPVGSDAPWLYCGQAAAADYSSFDALARRFLVAKVQPMIDAAERAGDEQTKREILQKLETPAGLSQEGGVPYLRGKYPMKKLGNGLLGKTIDRLPVGMRIVEEAAG